MRVFAGQSSLLLPAVQRPKAKIKTKQRPGKAVQESPWKRLPAPIYSQKRGGLESFPTTRPLCCYEIRQHRICKAPCKAYYLQAQPAGVHPRPPQKSEKRFPLPDQSARVGNTVSPAGSVGSQQSAAGARSPPAGLRCVSQGLRRVGGYRGNEIFFMCRVLCASGSPYSANESFFLCRHFSAFWARQGAFPGWTCPFPPVRGEGPSPGFYRPLRACVRELSRMSRGLACRIGRR